MLGQEEPLTLKEAKEKRKEVLARGWSVGGSVTKSLAGTAVDEIMKIGGWRKENTAKHYVGSTTSTRAPESKRTRGHVYAHANELPLSQAFESEFSACALK